MKKICLLAVILFLSVIFLNSNSVQTGTEKTFADIYEQSCDGVVKIIVTLNTEYKIEKNQQKNNKTKNDFLPLPHFSNSEYEILPLPYFSKTSCKNLNPLESSKPISQAVGSGFFYKDYIITNFHVVNNYQQIQIKTKDGTIYPAEFIGASPINDIAVLKINFTPKTTLVFANSNQVKVGQEVVAIGHPLGFEQFLTNGIICNLLGTHNQVPFFYNTTPINPGNSGGPLLDMQGKVIGINTILILSPNPITLSIKGNFAKEIIDKIIETTQTEENK